jgi:hypothetical protein
LRVRSCRQRSTSPNKTVDGISNHFIHLLYTMCVQRDFQSQASLVTHTHHRAMNLVTIWFFSFSLFPIVYRYYCDAPIAPYTCRQFSSIFGNVLSVEPGCYITMQKLKRAPANAANCSAFDHHLLL